MLRVGLVLVLLAAAHARGQDAPPRERVRGVTISCQTWGKEWGTDAMLEAYDELKALGTTWVAIHPYAGIRGDGTVRVW